MDLNELIGYYTAKLAYPDLTQHSRNIATETLNELVRLSAELAVKDQAIAELRLDLEWLEMENHRMADYMEE